ncbi:uncharacterized protein VTP21DRAFT_2208 [Calcarisporiella thermophila]|uniref:uncharacterized protein n=1 Tax=Calcarisporiella thermophila TaxID=911321 RepID=UPI0037423367
MSSSSHSVEDAAVVPDISSGAQSIGEDNQWLIQRSGDKDGWPQLQVIDENQKFSDQLQDYMQKKWELDDVGFNYNVVAVFGSQSTGKSTLLNKLFGTRFDVMSEQRRAQTTKGIWVGQGKGMRVLIMDVEGTDGRERGENQDFERKSALFSMAIAEVLIVNLWEHQVGLYNGANMGLLKTVFEVNLQLFHAQKGKEKTLLLFVIRDHIGTTPLGNLANTLTTDLENIWAGLSKPAGLEDCKIQDYFDLMFTTLPHKILQPEEFDKQVEQLRYRFVNPNDKSFVFQRAYHKRVPADGFHVYAQNIWEKIISNKDLDLPTQQELLAQYRCDEILNAAFDAFQEKIKGFKHPVESGQVVEDLGNQMKEIREAALAQFDKDASRYHAEVYKRKRREILNKMNASLHVFFLAQLKNVQRKVTEQFVAELRDKLKADTVDFLTIVSEARKTAESYFLKQAEAMKLSETDWTFETEHSQLMADLEEVASKARVEEMRKLTKQLEQTIERSIIDPLSVFMNEAAPDMWHKVIGLYRDVVGKAKSTLVKKTKSFNSSDDEIEESAAALEQRSWQLLRKKIDEEVADNMMMVKLRNRFEEKFRYDDKGLPRVWKPEDDIDGFFQKARDNALELIPRYAKIDLPEEEEGGGGRIQDCLQRRVRL